MKPTVLLDVDGVLADFTGAFLHALAVVGAGTFQREQVNQWDIGKALGISKDHEKAAYELVREQKFCLDMAVFDGAKQGVYKLREVAEVIACTSPMKSPYWMPEREEWLAIHFAFEPKEIIFTAQKHRVYAQYLIDDKADTVNAWNYNWHPVGCGLLWETPHNVNDRRELYSFSNWGSVVDLIKSGKYIV